MTTYQTSKTKIGSQISKTIGSSFVNLFSGKISFEIEHLSMASNHSYGKKQTFNQKYVQFGRGKNCGITYMYDDFPTVSSIHAAIEMVNDKWVLKHLSKTNPTIINDEVMNYEERFLQHGDIIQFSFEGPKVKFLLPGDNAPNINLASRTAILREQIKIHKKILYPLMSVFLLAIIVLGFLFIDLKKDFEIQQESISLIEKERDSLKNTFSEIDFDKIPQPDTVYVNRPEPKPRPVPPPAPPLPEIKTVVDIEQFILKELINDIVEFEGKKISISSGDKIEERQKSLSGVGFYVLHEKQKLFFSTREMISPWFYFDKNDPESYYFKFNNVVNSANPKPHIEVPFKIIKNGLEFKNHYFTVDTTKDEYYKTIATDGSIGLQQRGVPATNWAMSNIIPSSHDIKILWDKTLSLKENDTLYICAMSRQGLYLDTCIFKNETNSIIHTQKCSDLRTQNGAPVLYVKRGKNNENPKIYVVGIVTGWPEASFILSLKNIINK